jgi:hypothetical protein
VRPKKLDKREREVIAMRYSAYKRNTPKRICVEHGICKRSLHAYIREFRN